jgi:hypothetical protein
LVAADIVPLAVYPQETGSYFDRELLMDAPDATPEWLPEMTSEEQRLVGSVCRLVYAESFGPGSRFALYLDGTSGRGACLLR